MVSGQWQTRVRVPLGQEIYTATPLASPLGRSSAQRLVESVLPTSFKMGNWFNEIM
jgi:hypothetical protein